MGKYITQNSQKAKVVGYYDALLTNAKEAAEFTQTHFFNELHELVEISDTLFITTPDGMIGKVWDCMKSMSIEQKIICHFSGSLSSDVFSGMEETGAKGCSIHPMLAFSDKYSSYQQLHNAFFTVEGDKEAVHAIESLFTELGNALCKIEKDKKPMYHAAASILSNHVIAVLDCGYNLLTECGFSREDARKASEALVRLNVENVLQKDTVDALTGPIDRGDLLTVQKHKSVLAGEDWEMYALLGKRLVGLAQQKNKDKDYREMLKELERNEGVR